MNSIMNLFNTYHKTAIRGSLRDYFKLFLPDLAPFIRFESAKFLDEVLVDLFGEKEADSLVLVSLETDEGVKWFLIHWGCAEDREFKERMFYYFSGIYFKHGQAVFPIAMDLGPIVAKNAAFSKAS